MSDHARGQAGSPHRRVPRGACLPGIWKAKLINHLICPAPSLSLWLCHQPSLAKEVSYYGASGTPFDILKYLHILLLVSVK